MICSSCCCFCSSTFIIRWKGGRKGGRDVQADEGSYKAEPGEDNCIYKPWR